MDKLVNVIKGASKGSGVKADDDFVDRLNSRYTVALIVVFALVVSGQQYFIGNPLNCWEPKHFTKSHKLYMNSYCWVKNTYYLPMNKNVPQEMNDDRRIVPYYQWIPFILLGQALCFFFPSFVWHGLNDRAGVDSDDILSTAHKLSATKDAEERNKILYFLAQQFHRFLYAKGPISTESLTEKCKKPQTKAYLLTLFLISKILYIVNVIAQVFALNKILGTKYGTFGIEIFKHGYNKMSASDDSNGVINWKESAEHTFPTVTMCDFQIRRLGNVHSYTVQCVLPINMYNEKIYVFLWFWFMMVAVVTILNFLFWLLRSVIWIDKENYVLNHLVTVKNRKENNDFEEELAKNFVHKYLQSDGVFLIRLIGHNCNFITTNDITRSIWDFWVKSLENPKNEMESEALPLKSNQHDV